METIKKNEQSQNVPQKLIFLNFDRYFWSKDYTKLFLVLPGNLVVPVHTNFMKAEARHGIHARTPQGEG